MIVTLKSIRIVAQESKISHQTQCSYEQKTKREATSRESTMNIN